MGRHGKRQKRKKRPPVIFNTPGRECSHADKGCCPSCMTGRPKVRLHSQVPLARVRTAGTQANSDPYYLQ